MAFIEIRDLSFSYPVEKNKALTDISLSIEQGEFVVLCGASGSGKTTLLRHLKKETMPSGNRRGSIFIKGTPLQELDDVNAAKEIGMVFQDPENQIVMDTVIHELAFSLENFGTDSVTIKKRIAEMAAFFGIEDSLYKSIHELSGGQKQTVNLCSVLMLQPTLLLLDEPTSQLDPVAAHEFLKMVHELNQEFLISVIITEHRLEEVFPLADRVIYMEEGKIKYNGSPKDVSLEILKNADEKATPFLPSVTRLFNYLKLGREEDKEEINKKTGSMETGGTEMTETTERTDRIGKTEEIVDTEKNYIPMTVREGKQLLKKYEPIIKNRKDNYAGKLNLTNKNSNSKSYDNNRYSNSNYSNSNYSNSSNNGGKNLNDHKKEIVLECKDIYFRYKKENPLVLQKLSLPIYKGDFLTILGGNGSGKTTLLQILAGIHEPQLGEVRLNNKKIKKVSVRDRYKSIGYVAQNPLLHFTFDTVEDELQYSVSRVKGDSSRDKGIKDITETVTNRAIGDDPYTKKKQELIEHFEIGDILKRHPYDCSGGQQQKLALACALASDPEIVLIDEPTKGLDAVSKVQFSSLLSKLQETGLTIVMVTHDIEFAASYASRCAMLFDGSIVFSSGPNEFFRKNYFYTTVVNRVMRDYMPDAVTYKDVIEQWGK